MKLKVLSLNIWIGGILFDEMAAFLQEQNADILLLQEVFDGKDPQWDRRYRTVEELQKRLNYPHYHFAPSFLEDVKGELIVQGNLILSKFPLEEVSVVFYDVPFGQRINERAMFSMTPRSLQHVTADMNGTKLHLLNTQGIWGENGRDTERRIKMCQTIVAEVKDRQPLLLAGDFNVEEDTESVGLIEKELTNVFKGELETSFNVKQKNLEKDPGYATSVVDMMFVSDDIKIISHSCPPVNVSDHLPLVVEIELL